MDPAARRTLIGALYRSPAGSRVAGQAFEQWLASAHEVRGPLERKRTADRSRLDAVPGVPGHELDLERFLFAVECYLAVRAHLLVTATLQAARGLGATRSGRAAFAGVIDGAAAESPARLLEPGWLHDATRQVADAVVEGELSSARAVARRVLDGPLFDALQADHQALIPKQLRHMTGVYYTPQWLAQHVVTTAGYDAGRADLQVLSVTDPACGSGAFLVAAAEQLRTAVAAGTLPADKAVAVLADGIRGIDIDPLAVVQARANMRLAAIALGDTSDDVLAFRPSWLTEHDSLDYSLDFPAADIAVGNPPWVNWEHLPRPYRDRHQSLWADLGLFDLKGRDRAFSKEDISALFVAVAVDRYVADGGVVSFVLPQSLLKSALNHRGFRRFALREGRPGAVPYAVVEVEDMVDLHPFDGVANRPVVLRARRGNQTAYPVPYTRWTRSPAGRRLTAELATPENAQDPASHWTTGSRATLDTLQTVAGTSSYRARTGLFTGGANAVFHLVVLAERPGSVRVRNVTDRARRPVPQVETEIEPTFVYPFLRGRDVTQWRTDSHLFTLLPHTPASRMRPVPEADLATLAPRTYGYLDRFRAPLAERAGFTAWDRTVLDTAFYACQRVGDYTFAPWKVVWRYIAPRFTCAVVGPHAAPGEFHGKPVVPNEKLMLIACRTAEEAYYLCAVLSSSYAITHIHARMVSTQIAPHVIQRLPIPKYDASAPHTTLATLCHQGHALARTTHPIPPALLADLDTHAATVLGTPASTAHALRRQLMNDGHL